MTNRCIRILTVAATLAGAASGLVTEARAQGCIIIRNNEPLFGEGGSLPNFEKEWQVYMDWRDATSNQHYRGTVYQPQREDLHNNVVNKQRIVDLTATYLYSRRLSFALSVPYIDASWSVPLPAQPPLGERSKQDASGIGDVTAMARYWLLDPVRHPRGNWLAGVGIKAPTGAYDVKDEYPDLTGANPTNKAVDQSIQPGDGGWGLLLGVRGFREIGRTTIFGSADYMANPRDTNGTPSIISGLGLSGNPAFAGLDVNSVPDQYLLRTGVSVPIVKNRLSASVAFRMEGVPRYDLIGGSHGWRRPGYETFAEPGLTYSSGSSTWSLYVPIAMVRNREPNPYTGMQGDATFPGSVLIVGYSYRFASATPHVMSQ